MDTVFIGHDVFEDGELVNCMIKKVPISEAKPKQIIKCSICGKPATVIDTLHPWFTNGNRCDAHNDFGKYPLEDF